jgi:hypothetical protein
MRHMRRFAIAFAFAIMTIVTATATAAGGPIARFTWTPTSPAGGQSVHFDATTSSCPTAPCTYSWADDGPDGPGGTQWPLGSGQTLDFTFGDAGTKYVRLTVTDRRNRSATVEHDVVVSQAPPPPPPMTVRNSPSAVTSRPGT